ncbi:MAG: hypothetical protein FWB97_00480 [Oscillospiraceae bacterium]|nr:hypothetical protein [Oscillospiraceae bacterium]
MKTHKEQKLLEMYEAKGFGTCEICEECRMDVISAGHSRLSFPAGAFFVGENFDIQNIKLLIVGKIARGDYGDTYGGGMCNGRDLYNGTGKYPESKSWPFWAYTRQIAKNIFGVETCENIAMTNIVQCNNSEDIDMTLGTTKNHCIVDLGAVKEEIRVIKPNTVIFYTVVDYGNYTEHAFDEYSQKIATRIAVGQKSMKWNEGVGIIDGSPVNVLCIGHPERLNKNDYTNAVSQWIKQVN